MKMKRVLTLLFALALAFLPGGLGADAVAQGGKIFGTVKADDGDPLIGVYVYFKGLKGGVLTDLDGKYEIALPPRSGRFLLTFQYVGMQTREIPVSQARQLDVVLSADNTIESSMIVGAYRTKQSREDLVGSAFQINSEELKNKPVARTDNLLSGLVPGMTIQANTDAAGSPRTRLETRVRGESSLAASNEPLWIVDGVVQYTGGATNQMPGMSYTVSPLSYLDPSDIKSITVLKDADQVSIYGASGANGVILVTTKSGARNMPLKLYANVRYGVSAPDYSTMVKMMNADQYRAVAREAWTNAGYSLSDYPYQDNDYNSYSTTSTDWSRLYLGMGNNLYAQVSVTSGSKDFANALFLSYYKDRSTVIGNSTDRLSVRMKESFFLSDAASIDVNVNGSYTTDNLFALSNSYIDNLPIFSPYLEDGYTYRLYNKEWDATTADWKTYKFFDNELPNRAYNDNVQRAAVVNADAVLNWNILPYIRFVSSWGLRFQASHEDIYDSRRTLDGMDGTTPLGYSRRADASYVGWNNTETLEFKKKYGHHSIFTYAGIDLLARDNKMTAVSGSGFFNDHIKELAYATTISQSSTSSSTQNRQLSYFARAVYSFDSRYVFSANIRRDGNSIFGEYSRWGTFWSVGAAWNVHRESFFHVDWIDRLKLKGSFGRTGNSKIDVTDAKGTYNYGGSTSYGGAVGSVLANVPNPGLSWESVNKTNIGLDIKLFKKLDIQLEWYNDDTSDLLSKVYVSRTISDDRLYANVGRMRNRGVELMLTAELLKKGNFEWNLYLNAAHNKNVILELKDDMVTSFGTYVWQEGYDSSAWCLIRWAGVDPSDGTPMWYDKDGNLTKSYNYDNRVPNGKSRTPIVHGGITNNFSLGRWTLSAQLNYSIGGWVLPSYAQFMDDGYDITGGNQAVEVYYYHWKTPGKAAYFPKLSQASQHSRIYSDRFLYNATYFDLKSVTLTYDAGSALRKWIGIKDLSVSAICDNAYLFTPDQSRKFNSYKTLKNGYPVTRTFTISLGLTF